MTVNANARDLPVTAPVLATGITQVSGQVFVPADMAATVRAELVYRWWHTDEPTAATAWVPTAIIQTGPGKVFGMANIAAPGGLMIQIGLRLDESAGGTAYGRALLQYPIVMTA